MKRSLSDPDYVHIIASLRRSRLSKKMTQRILANTIGVSQSFVAKYETGERRLDVLEVLRVCRTLDINLSEVLPEHWRSVL